MSLELASTGPTLKRVARVGMSLVAVALGCACGQDFNALFPGDSGTPLDGTMPMSGTGSGSSGTGTGVMGHHDGGPSTGSGSNSGTMGSSTGTGSSSGTNMGSNSGSGSSSGSGSNSGSGSSGSGSGDAATDAPVDAPACPAHGQACTNGGPRCCNAPADTCIGGVCSACLLSGATCSSPGGRGGCCSQAPQLYCDNSSSCAACLGTGTMCTGDTQCCSGNCNRIVADAGADAGSGSGSSLGSACGN